MMQVLFPFNTFHIHSTIIQMKDKICVVTGASSGLGKATAEILAKMNARIIMISRENERGERSFKEIKNIGCGQIEWIPTDLSLVSSIKDLVKIIEHRYDKINFLFNCAGILLMKRLTTEEGLESILATNYLSHFLLTNMLYQHLLAGIPSKVITISGRGHKPNLSTGLNKGKIDFKDIQGEQRFSFVKASKQAVLAKIIFTYELSRRWQNTGIEVCTICPGLTRTSIVNHLHWFVRAYMSTRFAIQRAQSPQEGASHLIELAHRTNVNGKYFEGSKKGLKEAESSEESYDLHIAKELWNVSEQLLGHNFTY